VKRMSLLSCALVVFLLLFFGCSGEDGPIGPEGAGGAPGVPQPIKVLFAGAENPSVLQQMAVIAFRDALFPLGSEIHTVDVSDSVPPLPLLRDYDAVLYWQQTPTNYVDSLSNILGDYVDAGGGLVLCQWVFTTYAGYGLGGKLATYGYSPLTETPVSNIPGNRQIDFSSLSFPLHPIFNRTDVQNLVYHGWTNYSSPGLAPGATLIALDNNGDNAIAINAAGNIIGFNNWPNWTSDSYPEAEKLLANMLLYVAGAF
jgi:hypothetical protein